MSLHHNTGMIQPNTNNIIPAGKYIYTDETFQLEPPKYVQGESFPLRGKELVPAHFSYGHQISDFTLVAGGQPTAMNYNSYIYNALTGFV